MMIDDWWLIDMIDWLIDWLIASWVAFWTFFLGYEIFLITITGIIIIIIIITTYL